MVDHQRVSSWVHYLDSANFRSSKLKLEVYKPNKNRTTWKQSEKYKSRNWWFEFNSERVEVISSKVGRVFLMVIVFILPHAEFGRNNHRKRSIGVKLGSIRGKRSFIHFSKYSRTLRSVENKEMELERKIQETDKVLREVQSLKVKYLLIWLIWYESYLWIIF